MILIFNIPSSQSIINYQTLFINKNITILHFFYKTSTINNKKQKISYYIYSVLLVQFGGFLQSWRRSGRPWNIIIFITIVIKSTQKIVYKTTEEATVMLRLWWLHPEKYLSYFIQILNVAWISPNRKFILFTQHCKSLQFPTANNVEINKRLKHPY